jgi:hypothetical protein
LPHALSRPAPVKSEPNTLIAPPLSSVIPHEPYGIAAKA